MRDLFALPWAPFGPGRPAHQIRYFPNQRVLILKYIGNAAVRRGPLQIRARRGSDWELYGVSADRSETNDLTSTHPEVVKDIAAGWQE